MRFKLFFLILITCFVTDELFSMPANNQISIRALLFYDWGYLNPPSSGWSEDESVTYSYTTNGGLLENLWVFTGPVTKIPQEAFSNSPQSGTITLPSSVKNIEYRAFYGTQTTIILSDSLEYIGMQAFQNSTIYSININSPIKELGIGAFVGCSKLSEVSISKDAPLEIIPELCFYRCSNMNNINIPDNVRTIKTMAFSDCSKLKGITLPKQLALIEDNAFDNCGILATIVCNSLTPPYLGNNNFTFAKDNGKLIVPSESLEAYKKAEGWKDFFYISDGQHYKLIYQVDGEEYKSYEIECGTTITPEVAPTKEGYTFCGWSEIPERMPNHDVIVTGTFTPTTAASGMCGENVKWYYDEKNKTLKISGIGEMNDYTYNSSPWYDYRNDILSVVINEGVTSIGDHAFHDCMSMTSVEIPVSVVSIGVQAFSHCYKLTPLVIPDGVSTIKDHAFGWCDSIMTVSIPKSVTYLGKNPFFCSANLSTIIVDKQNPKYDSRKDCNAIIESASNEIVVGCNSTLIPNDVAGIGDYAFGGCRSININIPNGVTTIGEEAFWNCKGITSVILPNGLETIGRGAFFNCSDLISIEIPNSINNIGSAAFSGCSSLENVVIPNSVTKIEGFTFYGCNSLKSVVISHSVTNIAGNAFYGCNNLTSVTIGKQNPIEIEENVFTNRANATLYVPAGCRNAYAAADHWKDFKEILEPKFKLSYYVDGSEYKTSELEYRVSIVPEPEPCIEGYTFSGWSEIPETMPDHDVTVTGTFSINTYKLTYVIDGVEYMSYDIEYNAAITPMAFPTKFGYTFSGWSDIPAYMPAHDVTVTGSFEPRFDVGNVASVTDFILKGEYTQEDLELYDLNGDGELNIGDLILIVRRVLKNSAQYVASRTDTECHAAELAEYTAAQFVMSVPRSVREQDIRLTGGIAQTHQMMCEQIEPGRYAVVVFSLTNSRLTAGDNGFIEVRADGAQPGDVTIENVVLAKHTGETARFGKLAVATAIADVERDETHGAVYDLKGLKQKRVSQKGVYIENGKKIVVR